MEWHSRACLSHCTSPWWGDSELTSGQPTGEGGACEEGGAEGGTEDDERNVALCERLLSVIAGLYLCTVEYRRGVHSVNVSMYIL